jgi:hypothetical protein
MNVTFSELYQKSFESIVDRGRVRTTIQECDKHSFHNLGDRRYGLYVKRHASGKALPYYVWALCKIEEEAHLVYAALIILSTLDERLDAMSPFEMLERFLQDYGLPVQSELETAKLIYDETFWIETRDPAQVWTVPDKPEHYFLGSWTQMETFGVSSRIESHFVFAVDMGRYKTWLEPLHQAPTRRKRRKKRR